MTQVQPDPVTANNLLELVFDREFDAPIQAVFDAFVDPEQLPKWWGPEEMTVPVCEMDVREGGAWKTVMRSKDGKEHTVTGVYKQIQPPTKLVFTWGWVYDSGRGHETLVTIELSEHAGKTRMHFEQRTFAAAEHRDNHVHGWESTFRSLRAYLAQR